MQPELSPAAPTAAAAPDAAPSPRPRRRRRVLLLAALLLAVVGGGALGYSLAPQPPAVLLDGADPAIVKAVEAARRNVRLLPWSGAAWGRLGSVLFIHDFNAAADPCFARAEQFDPRNPRWPYLRARSLADQDPEAALPVLRRAVALCGDEPAAPRLQLAELLLERGRLEEAEGLFRQVHERDRGDARACLGLGRVALARGRLPEGLDYLLRSADAAPEIKASHVLLAAVYQRSGKAEAAERELRQAAALPEYPAWPDPFLGEAMGLRVGLDADLARARLLHGQDRLAEEVALLRRLIEAYPESDRAWEMFGSAYDRQGDLAAAERALRTAVRLAPTSVVARVQMGVVFDHQGKYAEAVTHFREATRLKPHLAAAHFNLGLCLSKQRELGAAVEALREATRLKPDLAVAHTELGVALFADGRVAEALESLRQAVRLNSQDTRAAELLQRVRRITARPDKAERP
jgi:tetratricopeptide (TPR) repeat protein